jgi:crotonobetainyl-CoA:carnitine CoA-transferase CaiB-like acyl-CoA transferase
MIVDVEHPGSTTPARLAGVPVKLTETPGGIRRRGPLLGEHTDEVLAEFGFTAAEILALRHDDVVR